MLNLFPISTDKIGIVFPHFVRFGVHRFKPFAPRPSHCNFLSWAYREQDAPDKNKKIQQWKYKGTTGVIPQHQIRKTPTGCWGFLLSVFLL